MEPPRREHTPEHQCVCAIKHPEYDRRDKCMAMVRNPDQPFCDYCEAAGHVNLPFQVARV